MNALNDKKNLDKELSDVLSEAAMLYQEEELGNTDIDELFIHRLVKQKRKRTFSRFTRTVAVVMLVLVTGVSISVWSQVDGVYGGKRFIQKCVTIISPLSIEEIINDSGEVTTITTVTEKKDIPKAKKVFENLKIARYIPEGYSFDKLTIREDAVTSSVEYIFSKGDEVLVIAFEYGTEDADIMVAGEEYVSPNTGKKLYVDENRELNEYSVIEICNEYDCIIAGRGHKEEGIRIIESIESL